MKTTVNCHHFAEAFRSYGRESQFTRPALFALFDYLEACEQDTGTELELDPIALCCDWAEYQTAVEAAKAYGVKFDDESDAIDWLREKTEVIEFRSGVLVRNF
ncbi:MAG: hypothetical protein EBT13_17735 [Rhodobacteraceae bacterium]|nr:hypothetical protein [Paracoccaceae bacterium]